MSTEYEILKLLEKLNYWEQNQGTKYGVKPDLKSTGEANARIADLKQWLIAKGAIFHWNGQEYILDAITEPGKGKQGLDNNIS